MVLVHIVLGDTTLIAHRMPNGYWHGEATSFAARERHEFHDLTDIQLGAIQFLATTGGELGNGKDNEVTRAIFASMHSVAKHATRLWPQYCRPFP